MPKIQVRPRVDAMLRDNTPVQDYQRQYGLWVKREDLSCPPPGPPFSKARGVWKRVSSRPEKIIGVLDTRHSQAGHAVARACQLLGKQCITYYPEFKHEPGWRPPQERARELGSELVGLPAGRSAILYHQARKLTEGWGGYMMPNALKLEESVAETAKEVPDLGCDVVLVPASSATIAAGVVKGFRDLGQHPKIVLHLGYSRSHEEVRRYIASMTGFDAKIDIIDEGYAYKDVAKPGETPPWPCNEYYDLKCFRWWMETGKTLYQSQTVLFWNIG